MRDSSWLPALVVLPLLALPLLGACGGRVSSNAPDMPAATAGSASTGGAAPSGGSGPARPPDDTRPPDNIVQPPFETPWWLTARWQDNTSNPVTDQCRAGLTEAEGLAAITSFGDQEEAVAVDAAGLLAAIEQFRDPRTRLQAKSPMVIHVFATPEGHLGAVSLVRQSASNVFYYFVLSSECRPIRLGYYQEYIDQAGCPRFGASPLWGMPEAPNELRTCFPRNGYYAYQAEVTQDTCARTPSRFSGVFSYRQPDAGHGELVFVDTAFEVHTRTSFAMEVQGEHAQGESEGNNECGPRLTKVWLEGDGRLRVEDERNTCEGGPSTHCLWKMQSPRSYGPLNY